MKFSRKGRLTRGLSAVLLGFTGASIGALLLFDGFVGWGVALLATSLLLAGIMYRWAGRSGDVAAALRVTAANANGGWTWMRRLLPVGSWPAPPSSGPSWKSCGPGILGDME